MNCLASAFEAAHSSSFRLFLLAAGVWLVVHLIFRPLKGGLLPLARGATAFALATAFYCGGLAFIMPSVPVLDSFDRPNEIADVQDPKKLLNLIQAQHTALVQTLIIQQRSAHALSLISLLAGFHGLSFLVRMCSAQKEKDCFSREGHSVHGGESENQ
jgi:hypothetical protein